jgi:hypothetical protein
MTTSVWCLETPIEQDSSYLLGEMIRLADETKDPDEIALIRSFWDNEDDWETVVERSQCESSAWYVWWMDGVRAFVRHEQKETADGHSV